MAIVRPRKLIVAGLIFLALLLVIPGLVRRVAWGPGADTAAQTTSGIVVPATPAPEGVIERRRDGPVIAGKPIMPAEERVTDPAPAQVEVVASGLEVPWDIAWTPDGRLFVTERPGRVRVIAGGELRAEPWIVFDDVEASGESGLMGMAVHPQFDRGEPWLYFAMTARNAQGNLENRVIRVREENGAPGKREVILDRIPAGRAHDGNQLEFGPDGKLYISTGEIWEKERAQEMADLGGKIHRLEPDGAIPADNPFGPRSSVYTLGHRNPQGLAFDSRTGHLWSTEHGPSGEWSGVGAYDEVNRIIAGKNYGWPLIIGAAGDPKYVDPVVVFPEHALPPAGIVVYSGRTIPEWGGSLFFASLRGATLVRVGLDDSARTRPVAIQRLFETDWSRGRYGRLRAVGEGPDGHLYFGTSNRDGRGKPAEDDDRILRLVPRRTAG